MNPVFTIVVPTVNRPETLVRTLRTLVEQPGDDSEILGTDDAGHAGNRAVVESFAPGSRIRYVRHVQGQGMRGNYEFSVGEAQGGYATILDADDGIFVDQVDDLRGKIISAPKRGNSLRRVARNPGARGGLRGQTAAGLSVKRAISGWFGSMDQDDINNKRDNLQARLEPVTGPIGDVRGFKPDNGVRGARFNMQLARALGQTGFTAGVGYNWAHAISYYRDAAGGGTPACADDAGVFQARSIGRNTCTASQYTLSLGYRDKRMFADLAFSPDVPRSASNQQKVRVNAGALW